MDQHLTNLEVVVSWWISTLNDCATLYHLTIMPQQPHKYNIGSEIAST